MRGRATAAAILLLLSSGPGVSASHRSPAGVATWYNDGPGLYGAAGPALRHGNWRGSRVRVCSGERCVVVTLRDWCACGPRGANATVLDLSSAAFRRLAPLSRGVVHVRVSAAKANGAEPTPHTRPATMPTPSQRLSVEMNTSSRPRYVALAEGRKRPIFVPTRGVDMTTRPVYCSSHEPRQPTGATRETDR